MNTVKVRWLGNKKNRVVELPIGLMSASEKTGEVSCNPVGEFPADEAKKLLSMPGASSMFIPEDEYQAALKPAAKPASAQPAPAAEVKKGKRHVSEARKQALHNQIVKMNQAKAAKKAAATQAQPADAA